MKKTAEDYELDWTLADTIVLDYEYEDVIYTLIEKEATDNNSSTYREAITKRIIGLQPSKSKLGYDDDFEPIEVKPSNYTGRVKLSGSGNFSDLTWKRHTKYIKDNVRMLISGFCNGKLLFIIEFTYSAIADRLQIQLKQKLPNGDQTSQYVRTATFSHTDWSDKPYKVLFVRPTIVNYKHAINKKLYNLLTSANHPNANKFFKCSE